MTKETVLLDRRHPAGIWLASAILVAGLLFLFLGWHIYESHRVLKELASVFAEEMKLATLVQTVRSDLSQEAHHIVRYGATEARLSAYETAAERLRGRFHSVASEARADRIAELRRIDAELGSLEHEAIDAVHWGRGDEGERLLHSARYLEATRALDDALRKLTDAVTADFEHRLQAYRRREGVSLSLELVIFLLSIALWWVLVDRLRRWRMQSELELGKRLEAEAQLRQAQKMGALGQMAAGVAHDFNNVLSAIRGYADLMTRAADKDRVDRASLKGIQAAAEQGAAVTRTLLTFSHRSGTDTQQLDLCALVRESVDLLRKTLPANIALRTAIECATGACRILGNRNQLHQILLNLALNARDAMPQGGTLEIAVSLEEGRRGTAGNGNVQSPIRLSVADTGGGIPEQIRERVFEPFFTTKPRGRSTGLGLAVVQAIAMDHEAEIELDSRAGSGTRISIRFPPAPAGAENRPAGTGKASPPVLVACADTYQARILASILGRVGLVEEICPDWTGLSNRIGTRKGPAAVVVMDSRLPGGAPDRCIPVLTDENRVRAVVLLAYQEDASIPEYEEAGFLVLVRPFAATELIRLVAGLSA